MSPQTLQKAEREKERNPKPLWGFQGDGREMPSKAPDKGRQKGSWSALRWVGGHLGPGGWVANGSDNPSGGY